MTSSVMRAPASNAEVQRALGLRVAKEMLGATGAVEIGPLRTHYYSFTFRVDAQTPAGPCGVFVKIPKVDMRGRVAAILPIAAEDRAIARHEADSLRLLAGKWSGAEVRWVSLRGVIEESNALVTDRIDAADAFAVFRGLDLRRRVGFKGAARRLTDAMARLGAALGRFHRQNAQAAVFRSAQALPKFERYCREIEAATRSPWPARALAAARARNAELGSVEVLTLKGLDMRNVLIDSRDQLYLLDPGKAKRACREADLARFVMTYRILHWGSALLPIVGAPDPAGEAAFLDSYYGDARPDNARVFDLFLLKEQLKHWHTALDSLRRLSWSPLASSLTRSVYVDLFYERQIADTLGRLRI